MFKLLYARITKYSSLNLESHQNLSSNKSLEFQEPLKEQSKLKLITLTIIQSASIVRTVTQNTSHLTMCRRTEEATIPEVASGVKFRGRIRDAQVIRRVAAEPANFGHKVI